MKLRIAIVDDDAQMRTRLRDCLNDLLGNSAGIAVFPSGEDFLAGWEAGRFDVILLDIFMESLTGMDVARKIRETDGQVKLVFCTTSNEFASESYTICASPSAASASRRCSTGSTLRKWKSCAPSACPTARLWRFAT